MERQTEDFITSYIDYVGETEAPPIYLEWVAISAIATAIQRKVKLEWFSRTFYPNMYIVLVGPAAVRKGTAMEDAKKLIREIGIPVAANSTSREALINHIKASVSSYDAEDGLTMHSSITINAEELAVFLGHGRIELIQALTDWFDCADNWSYSTLSRGDTSIDNLWVNMIGATTPSLIRSSLPSISVGGGLTSRIVFVYSDPVKPEGVPFPARPINHAQIKSALLHDLEAFNIYSGKAITTPEFLSRYGEWYTNSRLNPPFRNNPNLENYNMRRQVHLLKLCMLIAISENSIEGYRVILTEKVLERVIDLLDRTESVMEKTFAGFGSASNAATVARLMTVLEKRGTMTEKEVIQTLEGEIGAYSEIEDILLLLIKTGRITRRIAGTGYVVTHTP